MNYTKWNSLLYHYYFDNAEDNVFLFVDKDTLMQYALESSLFDNTFATLEKKDYRFNYDAKLDYIWQDFCRIFKDSTNKFSPSLDYFKKFVANKIADRSEELPQVFPFIALCLMPFEESQGLNANNFYDRVLGFLECNGIIQKKISKNTFSKAFTEIKGVIAMWEVLGNWAKEMHLPYSPKFTQRCDRNDYVYPFVCECLITPTKRQLFSVLFKNIGLAPNVDYQFSDNQIINYLNNRYSDLGLSTDLWKKYHRDYASILVDEFKRAYSKWDGSTRIIQRTGTRKERTDSGTVHNMFLMMQNIMGDYNFYLRLFAPQIERGEHVLLTINNEKLDTRIGIDGFGHNPILKNSPLLFQALQNNENITFSESAKDKAIFAPVDFFLFQQKGMEFTSACSISKGGHFYFLKRDDIQTYNNWLTENNSVLLKQNIKNTGYSLFNIPQVLTSLPLVSKLTCEEKKSATLVNTFKLRLEGNTYFLFNGFPAYFDIKGVDVTTDVIATTYDEKDNPKNSYKLEYCSDYNLWKMPVIKNVFDKSRDFKIFNDGIPLSNYRYSFRDLPDIIQTNYAELRYNKWGLYDPDGDFQGLTLPDIKASGIPIDMKRNMELTGKEPPANMDLYIASDYILYYLSSHPEKLTKRSELKDFFNVLNQNEIIEENDIEYKFNRLLNNYCRLGYINYFYDRRGAGESHLISVNRPTLIMLPPKYNVVTIPGLNRSFKCSESWFKFLLSGARTPAFMNKVISLAKNSKDIRVQVCNAQTPLYPHEVIIWAYTESAIKDYAQKLNIGLQFCIYSKTLFDKIGDIDSYIENTLTNESQYGYDNVQSFESIDYSEIAEVNTSQEYKIRMKNYINRDNDVVRYWPKTYNEENILWRNGHVYPIEKFWSSYVGAHINKAKIIRVDNYHIITPYKFRLPVIYDRALTLISGSLPSIITNRQYLDYSLYDSPFVHINSQIITKKLNQNY